MSKIVKPAGKDVANAKGKTYHGNPHKAEMGKIRSNLLGMAKNHTPQTNKGPGRK